MLKLSVSPVAGLRCSQSLQAKPTGGLDTNRPPLRGQWRAACMRVLGCVHWLECMRACPGALGGRCALCAGVVVKCVQRVLYRASRGACFAFA